VVATALHSLLDPLGRDACLLELVRDPVKLVGMPHGVVDIEELLLAAAVPISLSLDLVGVPTVDYWGPV
jgi:hypothetical protein